jgi:GLPGLI family protein
MLESDLSKGTVTLQEISSNPNLREKYPRPGPLNRYQLYINYPENKTTTTDFIFSGQYFFEEQNEVLDWTILSDTTQILGNNCQKALTTFRGRSYIAWFAPDIPLSAGPYKFRGLPGLIVKVEDTKSNFVYECIGIEYLLQKRPIVFNGSSFTKVTRTEYRKLLKAGFDNPYEVLINANRGHITMSEEVAAKIRREMQRPLPYNPIELE